MNARQKDPTHHCENNIKIKLQPGSSKNQITGKEGDAFKVKVTSPPVDGKANRMLVELLAKCLGVPKRDIKIISGKSSKLKTVRIRGPSRKEIHLLLGDSQS